MTLKYKPQFDASAQYFDERQARLFHRNITAQHGKIVEMLDEIEKYAHQEQKNAQEQGGDVWTQWSGHRLPKLYGIRLRDAMLSLQLWSSNITLMLDPHDKTEAPLTTLRATMETTMRRTAILMNQYEVFAVGEGLQR